MSLSTPVKVGLGLAVLGGVIFFATRSKSAPVVQPLTDPNAKPKIPEPSIAPPPPPSDGSQGYGSSMSFLGIGEDPPVLTLGKVLSPDSPTAPPGVPYSKPYWERDWNQDQADLETMYGVDDTLTNSGPITLGHSTASNP